MLFQHSERDAGQCKYLCCVFQFNLFFWKHCFLLFHSKWYLDMFQKFFMGFDCRIWPVQVYSQVSFRVPNTFWHVSIHKHFPKFRFLTTAKAVIIWEAHQFITLVPILAFPEGVLSQSWLHTSQLELWSCNNFPKMARAPDSLILQEPESSWKELWDPGQEVLSIIRALEEW